MTRPKLHSALLSLRRRVRLYRAYTLKERPGIKGVPHRLSRLQLSRMASSISYFMVFTMFPFMILVVSLVAVFGDRLIQSGLKAIDAKAFLPDAVLEILRSLVDNILSANTATLISVSILSLLWAASKGINALVTSLHEIYRRFPKGKGYLFNRLLSILITILIGVFVMVILLVLAFGEALLIQITRWTGIVIANRTIIRLTTFGTGFAILTLALLLIYYFSSGRKGGFAEAAASAALGSLGWVLLSGLFSVYVNHSDSLSVYGSLTSIIILLLWLYASSYVLLLGAVIHAALIDAEHRKYRTPNPDSNRLRAE